MYTVTYLWIDETCDCFKVNNLNHAKAMMYSANMIEDIVSAYVEDEEENIVYI